MASPSPCVIRLARPGDAHAIAEIHVESWRAAYRGLMPDSLLDNLSVEQRARTWRERLEAPGPSERRIWIAEANDASVGFACTAPSSEDDLDPGRVAELLIMYLRSDAWGRGHGRALMQQSVEDLRGRGFEELVLWVLDSNVRARRFYERTGLCSDGIMKTEHIDGVPLEHVRYRGSLDRMST